MLVGRFVCLYQTRSNGLADALLQHLIAVRFGHLQSAQRLQVEALLQLHLERLLAAVHPAGTVELVGALAVQSGIIVRRTEVVHRLEELLVVAVDHVERRKVAGGVRGQIDACVVGKWTLEWGIGNSVIEQSKVQIEIQMGIQTFEPKIILLLDHVNRITNIDRNLVVVPGDEAMQAAVVTFDAVGRADRRTAHKRAVRIERVVGGRAQLFAQWTVVDRLVASR